MESPRIGITLGDPSGIGPEIVVKALEQSDLGTSGRLIVFGDGELLAQTQSRLGSDLPLNRIETVESGPCSSEAVNLLDLDNVEVRQLRPGEVQAASGRAAFEYITEATKRAMEGELHGIATAPINKQSLREAGIEYVGHTEMLAELTGTSHPLTMYQVRNLRVFFLTRHLSLIRACKRVTVDRVQSCIRSSARALERVGIQKPALAVAALNPHAGDGGLFGDEEIRQIRPAVESCRENGLDVEGPLPADSVFHFALEGEYDAVVALYHDQGQMATKMVDFERTISVTHNLPFIRTSVHHGTAFDIADTGRASPASMIEAIRAADRYASDDVRSDVGR